jgi:hypothetical protein
MNEGGDTPFSTLEIDMISKKPLLCRKYAHRMKDAQASGHYCQALGKCRLPRHTLPCYLFFKIEQIYAINANYNRFSTITQKVGKMKITLKQGYKPP